MIHCTSRKPFSPTLKERLRKKSKRSQVEFRNVFQNRSFFQKKVFQENYLFDMWNAVLTIPARKIYQTLRKIFNRSSKTNTVIPAEKNFFSSERSSGHVDCRFDTPVREIFSFVATFFVYSPKTFATEFSYKGFNFTGKRSRHVVCSFANTAGTCMLQN